MGGIWCSTHICNMDARRCDKGLARTLRVRRVSDQDPTSLESRIHSTGLAPSANHLCSGLVFIARSSSAVKDYATTYMFKETTTMYTIRP